MSIIRETAELQAAMYEVVAARAGDSNDHEIDMLVNALDLALDRWPEIDPEPPIWFVSEVHISEHWRTEILLHLEDCGHWWTEADGPHRDPDPRQTTAQERTRQRDALGRTWRHCITCDDRIAKIAASR